MNVYIPYIRLPSAYQEVEYIQGTGTQAIDCNIVIGTTKLKTDLKINSQYIGESAIFLSKWALNGNFLMFYNNAFRWHSASAVDISCALNTDYSIQTENGKITINGTSYTCTASSSDSGSDLSMCIFGKSGARTYGRFKLYYMKMWNNTTLVRDLVPCYRKSDSVIGMYDLVNNQFYTNSGTGTFSKGNDVTMAVLKNAYIGEVWTPGENTIAYYPLTSQTTVNEYSGKNKPLTNTGVTFGTYKGVDCAYLDGNHFLKNETSYGLSGSFTALIWAYYVKISNIDYEQPRFYGDDSGNIGIWIEPVKVEIGYNPRGSETRQTLASDSGWKLLTVVYDGTNCKLYVNNANVDTTAKSGYTYTDIKLGIGGYVSTPLYWKGGLSEFILENKARTAQEIQDYYNKTKANYGL